jgi:Leucine-rich repeat (LRR) protein
MKKHYTYLLLVITILLSKTITTKAQIDVNDSLALVDLYNSTDGQHWNNNTNWLSEKPVSEWRGIYLSGNRVSQIVLYGNGLKGILPLSLGNLTDLVELSLQFNQLNGSIPPELGNLTNLDGLSLSDNQLSGSIPPELGNLTNLDGLSLYNNQLSGSIPPEIGKLTGLDYLYLYNNQLSGSIPPEIGKLTALDYLYLSYNQISGSIPPELGNLTNLSTLSLADNQLSGSIPPELGNLTNLGELYLYNNQLSGSIPPALGNLTTLFRLYLNNNQLSGNIPSELGYLVRLQFLNLSHNKLHGHIPASFRNLKKLREINIAGNELRNPQTFDPGAFNTALEHADIRSNHFTFDGIETLVQYAQYDFDLKYAPQKKIRLHQNTNKFSVYAGGTLSNNTYKWFKDGSLVATKQGDSTFEPTQSGAYTVQVNNAIATALTLNSDTITFNTATGIRQNDIAFIQTAGKNIFSVYPNPAKTTATITFNTTGNCTIQLTDVSGKILQIKTVTAIKDKNLMQLDVSKYGAGVYFVTISNEKNETATLRLNKE